VTARKLSDLSACTVAWLRPWLGCYWPRNRSALSPCTAEGASFGMLFPACQGGSLVTPELKIEGQKMPAKRRKHGGGSALRGLRPVPFTSEAPGGRPRSGGGGSEELPHELRCNCDGCLNG